MAQTPSNELVRVRKQLDGLQYARLIGLTPALEARRQELSRREVVLLGAEALPRSQRFLKSPR